MDYKQLAGVELDEYRLVEIIGSGGMSAVYRAYQEELDRDVAVKVLSSQLASDESYITRFNQEAKIAASLEHPHIVPVYDFGNHNEMMYVVMRFLTAGTLYDKLNDQPMNKREVMTIVTAIAQALDYAHGRNIVHRDVKPGNIMFDSQGTAYLVDFGIAKATQGQDLNLTANNMVMGTPMYMPPEQWQGLTPVPATDQYALAVITYRMLTGVAPFEGDSSQNLMYQHMNNAPTPANQVNRNLSGDVGTVLNRAMSKSPDDRYPLITNFANALQQALDKPPTPATIEHQAAETILNQRAPQPMIQPNRVASSPPSHQPETQSNPMISLIGGGMAGLILLVVLFIGGGFAITQFQNRNNDTADNDNNSGIDNSGSQVVIEPTDIVLTDVDEGESSGIVLTPLVPVDVVGFSNLPLGQRTVLVNEPTIPVRDAVYSPNGQVIASAHGDGTVRFWRGGTATIRNAHAESASTIAFTPDGQFVASGGRDNDVKIWRVDTADNIQTLTGHLGVIRDLEFSPDGSKLATASEDTTIRIWRVSDWALEATLTNHDSRVLGLSWNHDGTLLASGGNDNRVFLWDMTANRFTRYLSGHTEQVRDVDFNPDGQKLVSSSTDNTLKIWDVATGQVLHTMDGHGRDVWTVLFSPDGQIIASGGRDNTLRLWNAETGAQLDNITNHVGWVLGVSFSADGTALVSAGGDGTIRIWE